MHDGTRVMAGECTTVFEGSREREQRGDVLVVVKPDNTVLVHDAAGYQPVAWLTRAESVAVEDGVVTARDGEELLRVVAHEEHGSARFPASHAGVPVADCPDCAGTLVRARGSVTCTDCAAAYGLPSNATVTGGRCDDCGLPTMRVERGEAFELCLDRDCQSLDDRVTAAFDRAWDCPDCDGDLRIIRRGGLLAGCEHYPDCDTGFSVPSGVVVDECSCGLPVFETAGGRRCLDSTCEQELVGTP
ncbi:endonuclease NucS [Halomicroarcula sp. F13]|uniref:Endonuclease NucS n=1 Tax=Haloarcula rubra TaxID=2487747 RepID=A0AAW4PMR3_9EURY|nr:endonuclease NucS domain-containing protein [Halomicroarcula rubra]MBX0322323.1 endonuclease NucS [Halomicroarcula rubra]